MIRIARRAGCLNQGEGAGSFLDIGQGGCETASARQPETYARRAVDLANGFV